MVTSTAPSEAGVGPEALPLPPVLLRELAHALRTIRYGAVELVIHDGRVVQLERREKVRIDNEVTPRK
ncbi:MAG: YezD family protein [Gemmatimonadales bacterium]